MSFKEKLIKYLEDRKKSNVLSSEDKFEEDVDILCFINSMQDDETMTIRKNWFEHCKKSWYNEGFIDGKYNQEKQFEDSVSEDLKDAADSYAKDVAYIDGEISNYGINADERDAFKAGAEWYESQMMKKSFQATVHKIGSTYLKEMSADDISNALKQFENNTKVKVIIVKDE